MKLHSFDSGALAHQHTHTRAGLHDCTLSWQPLLLARETLSPQRASSALSATYTLLLEMSCFVAVHLQK